MTSILGEYQGNLRTSLTHKSSNSQLITDAPLDNHGKGEFFSPTDLLAAALGSCMVTIMGIRANTKNISLEPFQFQIKKIMQSNPRKVGRVEIEIICSKDILLEDRAYLEKEARECPVALSLSKDLEQRITFSYV
jgi:uncharacterized OsmC-like protein